MYETHTGHIPLSNILILKARKAHIFDGLHSDSIIYLGKLFYDDYIAILGHNEIDILKDSKIILKGRRNKSDGLWNIPISKPLRYRAHAIITRDKIKIEPIQYLHGCCFSPTPRTFLKAIKN